MPIYEYKCAKCGESFELLVRGKEKPACPSCGSKRLKKLVSAFAAVSEKYSLRGCSGNRRCLKTRPVCGCGGHCGCNGGCGCS